MSDETAANIADAGTNAEFAQMLAQESANEAAGISDTQDGVDITPLEDKEDPADPAPDADPDPVDPDPQDPDPADPNDPADPADPASEHDINATLKEEDPAEDPKDPKQDIADNAPQFVKDAKNLAGKWDDMTDGERLDKVKALAKNRPHTFNALAKELGTSSELLLSKHELDSTDLSPIDGNGKEFDPEALLKEAEDRAYARMKAENANSPERGEAERNRFMSETANFAKHNKLDAETTKAITSLDGDLYKKFASLKYDPETGQELSVKGRLRLALNGSDTVKDAMIKSGVISRSKRVVAGVHNALPKSGRPGTSSKGTDAESVASSSDADFAKTMAGLSSGGVVPLEV